MPTSRTNARIERWEATHPRFESLLSFADEQGEGVVLDRKTSYWHNGLPYTLVALVDDRMVGYLRFWTQQIGIDQDKPGLERDGTPVLEAKVVAIFVRPEVRRRGIGTSLKKAAMSWARDFGCYQIRERSDCRAEANHALNLSMGYGMQPAVHEGEGEASASFVMALATL
jgi:GNAT superfamily N-acetyltransferase